LQRSDAATAPGTGPSDPTAPAACSATPGAGASGCTDAAACGTTPSAAARAAPACRASREVHAAMPGGNDAQPDQHGLHRCAPVSCRHQE
jgi:hypothetical protein